MWAGIGRGLLYALSAFGIYDIFDGSEEPSSFGSKMWRNPLVLMAMLIVVIILLNNIAKLRNK